MGVMVERDKVEDLNKMNPASANAQVGTHLDELTAAYNDLAAKYDALLAKLDADSGVGDTDYESGLGTATTVTAIADR